MMFRRGLMFHKINNNEDDYCVFRTTKTNEKVRFIYNSICQSVVLEDGTELPSNYSYEYVYPEPGDHKVLITLKPNLTVLEDGSSPFIDSAKLIKIAGTFLKGQHKLTSINFLCYRSSITEIPEGLLDDCENVTTAIQSFAICKQLMGIPEKLFRVSKKINDFQYCFQQDSALKGSTPTDEDGGKLWEREGKPGYPSVISADNCFWGCWALTEYYNIPSNWK